MRAQLDAYYSIYADLEEIPAEADNAARAGAESREAALAEATRLQRKAENRHVQAVETVRSRYQAAYDEVENRLKIAAQSATQKGALPAASASGANGSPDFASMRILDTRLGNAIESKRKLEFQLRQFKDQMKREGSHAEARKRDRLTLFLFGGGAIASIIIGANLLGAIIATVSASIAQLRLTHWQSAFVLAQSEKFPSVGYDARLRGAVVRVVVGWVLLGVLLVSAVVSSVLQHVHAYWSESGLWRWMPSGDLGTPGFGAYLSAFFFWLAFVYAIVLLVTGYVRRVGR